MQLAKRFEKRDEAREEEEEAKETGKISPRELPTYCRILVPNALSLGTTEDMDRQARRQVRVTKEHKTEVQRLLKLMGIPYHDVRLLQSK